MRTRRMRGPTLLLLWAFFSGAANAAVPGLMKFQGRLVDPGTRNPLEGSYSFTFRICDSLAGACTGANKLWEETQSVTATNGVFDVRLGEVVALSSTVFSGAAQFLEMEIAGETLSPREPITAEPMALRAAVADTVEAGDPDYIHVADALQAGAIFYVSSGTVEGDFVAFGNVSAGGDLEVGGNTIAGGVITAGSGAHQITGGTGLLDAAKIDASGFVPNASIDPSSVAKFNASGLIPSFFLDSSSITKQGNTFNAGDRLLLLDAGARVPNVHVNASSVTKLGNAYNLPNGPVKIAGDAYIEDYLIDGSSIAKLSAAGLVPGELLNSSSITMQANTFNGAQQLVRLDSSGNMTLPYGVDAATGRFTTGVGIGAAAPSSGLYVLGNMRIDTAGTVIAEDSEVRVTTTTGVRGITFQTGRRQKTAARWELVSAQSGPDPVAFTGLDGNADVMYLLVYEVRADGGVEWGLQYNSDTGNNYEMIDINTTGAGAINSDDTGGIGLIRIPAQFVQASGDFYSGELKIFAQSGRRRALINHMLRGDGGNGSLEWASGAGWWTNTASNLTRIDIIGNFSAASDFRLYRRIR